MIRFLNTYKEFILGSILVPIGLGIIFGTIISFIPNPSRVNPIGLIESIYTATKIIYLIWLGAIVFFIGTGYMVGSQESKELTINLKELFTKEK